MLCGLVLTRPLLHLDMCNFLFRVTYLVFSLAYLVFSPEPVRSPDYSLINIRGVVPSLSATLSFRSLWLQQKYPSTTLHSC